MRRNLTLMIRRSTPPVDIQSQMNPVCDPIQISVRSILILCCHLRLDLPRGLLSSFSQLVSYFLFSPCIIITTLPVKQLMTVMQFMRVTICYKVHKVLGKPEGKRPLGRPRRRWEDGIRMDLGETGLGGGLDSTGSG
jgi:hypothetical protein